MEVQHADKVLRHAYFPQGGKKRKRKRFGRFARALMTGGASEIAHNRKLRNAVLSGGLSLATNHAQKKKKKGLFKRIAKGLLTGGASEIVANRKKIGGALKNIAKISVGAALLPAVLPLAPVIRAALKKKGLNPSKKIKDLLQQFYTQIVKKNSHYDRPDTAGEDHFLPIAAIIPPIISFVKGMIAKKKSGQKLSPTENIIASGSENVIEEIKAKVPEASLPPELPGSNSKDSASSGVRSDGEASEKNEAGSGKRKKGGKKKGGSLGKMKMPLIIGGVALAAVVGFMVMRKS